MHAASKQLTERASKGRDKVSNGRLLPPGIDMRSSTGRRYRYLVAAYSAELGAELTEPEKALVRQVASLQLRIEQLQGRIVQGEDVDADQVIRLASEHRRLLSQLSGRAVQSKPPSPTILDLAAELAAEAAAT